jgi:hypothetical protein
MGRSREGGQERLWQAQRMKLIKQVRYLWQAGAFYDAHW